MLSRQRRTQPRRHFDHHWAVSAQDRRHPPADPTRGNGRWWNPAHRAGRSPIGRSTPGSGPVRAGRVWSESGHNRPPALHKGRQNRSRNSNRKAWSKRSRPRRTVSAPRLDVGAVRARHHFYAHRTVSCTSANDDLCISAKTRPIVSARQGGHGCHRLSPFDVMNPRRPSHHEREAKQPPRFGWPADHSGYQEPPP
jgi:hypothetical protein